MIKADETIVMRAIAICFKPFLKPEEALVYCNLGRTQFAKRCQEIGIYKNNGGYYKKEDLDRLCTGDEVNITEVISKFVAKRKSNYL